MLTSSSIRIIAEAGVNHNGNLGIALDLVDAAADAGADIVKFQTFNAKALASSGAPKAAYQLRNHATDESQLEMLERLQLSLDDHIAIIDKCKTRGIAFLSSPFDSLSLKLLSEQLGLSLLKLGSGELTNGPLLLEAARTGCDLILSTGMASLGEVEDALGVLAFGISESREQPGKEHFEEAWRSPELRAQLSERLILLHCTTEYPAPIFETNLRAMQTMREAFGINVGYSDHTEGHAVSLAAAALGATILEKHITLDRKLDGPDHKASIEPTEFKLLVDGVRSIELALGDGIKVPGSAELANRAVARKSLMLARPLRAGQTITEQDLHIKRPGTGRSPMEFWRTAGSQVARDYAEGEVLDS